MNDIDATHTVGPYRGEVAFAFATPQVFKQLSELPHLLTDNRIERLSHGGDYVVKVPLQLDSEEVDITIKVFKRQSKFKDWYDQKNKSKAERSYIAARHLQEHGVGTPAPIAWLDRWDNGRLMESYYLCLYEPAICLRDALSDIYYNQRDNEPLMDLLLTVAPAIRAMHDAGFMHGDMGNQNILLPKQEDGRWGQPQFIDLNRCKIQEAPLNNEQRAFDLSRVILPGAYLKIFKFIYCHHQDIPAELENLERKFRRRFEWHTRSRKYRRPLRYLKNRRNRPTKPVYPSLQNIWLWDEKSAQPMTVMDKREKRRYRSLGYVVKTAWQSMVAMPKILKHYNVILAESYQQPVEMRNRIGVAIHPKDEYWQRELPMLQELGNPPVLIRFCHHETPADWAKGIALVEQLHIQGISIMAALLQDRRAILEPDQWANFLESVITAIADKVNHIEITHAFNRVKWGVWNAKEYSQLMQPAFALKKRFPTIKLTGPACIDFEYHPTIAALNTIPAGQKFSALSHLLYVDRRGAPEGKQGRFSTLEKCALLKALARWSDHCEDKVIVSEVNWPIKYTGIWSPIGCPYEAPQWRRDEPGETEEIYAHYMLRYLAISICSGHVEQVFWWRLSAHGYGLVDDCNDFRKRPAYNALVFFLDLLGKATFIGKREVSGIYALEFKKDNQNIMMLWQTGEGQKPLPKLTYSHAFDWRGTRITDVFVSASPIYLLTEH